MRFTSAGLAIGTATVAFLALREAPPAAQGIALFFSLAIVAFVYCLLGGLAATADCISEEKREGTLGLLFLTDLRPFDVILGKMMAGSARATLALVALIPVITVPLLMGGVPGGAVRNVALALLNTLFLTLALGVFVSVIARDARGAVSGAFLSLIVLLVLLPTIRWVILDYFRPAIYANAVPVPGNHLVDQHLAWLLVINPVILLFTSLGNVAGLGGSSRDFWYCLGCQHGLAWLLLASACIILPRSWQDRVERRAAPRSAPGAAGEMEADPAMRRRRSHVERARFLDHEPFSWMITREWRPVFATWAGLAAIGAVWIWGFLEMKSEWLQAPIGLFTLFFAALWLKLRLTNAACRPLHEHRRTGALELLLVTPLQPDAILRGYAAGLRSAFGPPTVLVLVAAVPLIYFGIRNSYSASDTHELLLTFVGGLAVLVLDLVALAWAGAWHSLRSQRYVRAVSLCVLQILLLPWVLFVVSLILIAITIDMLNLNATLDFGPLSVLAWWIFLSAAVDAWVIVTCARRLRTRFLDLATGRFDVPPPAPPAVPPPAPPGDAAAVAGTPAAG